MIVSNAFLEASFIRSHLSVYLGSLSRNIVLKKAFDHKKIGRCLA